MMKIENVTMYCRHESEEAAKEHIETITTINTRDLVGFGVDYDDKRGWHSWTTRKQRIDTREVQEDE